MFMLAELDAGTEWLDTNVWAWASLTDLIGLAKSTWKPRHWQAFLFNSMGPQGDSDNCPVSLREVTGKMCERERETERKGHNRTTSNFLSPPKLVLEKVPCSTFCRPQIARHVL